MLIFKNSKSKKLRQFFRILSQNQEYVKTHFNDSNNLFHFACRGWILYNQL